MRLGSLRISLGGGEITGADAVRVPTLAGGWLARVSQVTNPSSFAGRATAHMESLHQAYVASVQTLVANATETVAPATSAEAADPESITVE